MTRVTLREVAEASGVSQATVSYVLNQRPDKTISESTRRRVLRAAEDLAYVPNGHAKALAEGMSRIVVLELSGEREGHYSSSFIGGLDDELALHDHVLLMRHGRHTPPSTERMLASLAPRAIVRFGSAYRSAARPEHLSLPGWEARMGADIALQIGYLAGKGHAEIVFASPHRDVPFADFHAERAHEEAESRRLAPPLELRLGATRADTAETLAQFVQRHPSVTALAAYNDETAAEILAAMCELGLRAPQQLAVIGFDETTLAALVSPALTTVRIDGEGFGRTVARRALGLTPVDGLDPVSRVIERDSA